MSERFGVNYLPSYSGPAFWRDFRPDEIAADLEALAGQGVGFVRGFVMWSEFMPTRERAEPETLERLSTFAALVGDAGLRLQLTLLVGHMSGENFPPPWLDEPAELYRDPALLDLQARFVGELVAAVKEARCVDSYVLTNEGTRFMGDAPAADVEAWASRLHAAVKEVDSDRPVLLGDGGWWALGEDNGFAATHAQDAIGLHLYLSDTDPERLVAGHGLAVGVAAALAGGKDVWLEEFGAPHSSFGEEEAAEWAGKVAIEARLQGAMRVCWWCAFDFNLPEQDPYRHHAFEMTFGMLRADRSPRPVAAALREAADAPLPELPEAGLLVPSHLLRRYPFADEDRDVTTRALRNSYAALRRLGYLPRIVLEEALGSGAAVPDILVVPSAQKLLAPTWEALERHPGTVIFSYSHGTSAPYGAWTHRAREFFGGQPRNRPGLPEEAPGYVVVGEQTVWFHETDQFAATPLLIEPEGAEVLGIDQLDRPTLLRVGRRFMLLYPLEAVAHDPRPVEKLYRFVLERA
jgi:endo-1,4-beta-mannosidase